SAVLDVIAWGGSPREFEWFEAPRTEAVEAAVRLLERLGALDRGTLTPVGRTLQRLPIPPRLGRILIAGGGARQLAQAGALWSQRPYLPVHAPTTASDLLSALDKWNESPAHVQQIAREIETLISVASGLSRTPRPEVADAEFRRAILAGYPDRVAQRRTTG